MKFSLATPTFGFLDTLLYVVYTFCSVSGLILIKKNLSLAVLFLRSGVFIQEDVLLAAMGVGFYISSFTLWMLILTRTDLSVAYPISVALTLTFSTIAAQVLLGEALSTTRIAGIAVVFVGIWMITRSQSA